MNQKLQKLELNWIGKGKEPKLEPRILIEDPSNSFGDAKNQNMLIHGDNLLALKAIEQNFSGQIKCIYIDPPFNTGSAFEHYDDGLEHSIWLELMSRRLKLLHSLLKNDGAIFIHIDYNEEAYLRVLMDDIFGRSNFRNTIICSRVKKNVRERERVKALNFSHDVILFYSKSDDTLILPPLKESDKPERWHALDAPGFRNGMDYELYGVKPAPNRHWAWTEKNARTAVSNYDTWSKNNSSESLTSYWEHTGGNLKFIRPNPRTKKPEYFIPASSHEVMDTNWYDLQASAFNWKFPNGEKNEKLIQRILDMVTKEGDWVLDSFLGSGTTAAVAHKMKRKWIGVELGEHAVTHCLPRLQKVVEGKDDGGITEAVNWKGGGGFKFYTLAPSLILKDKYGSEIINPAYNPNMLAAAMAKQEGFQYSPDAAAYWKQGKSSEKDFIFTTTQFVTVEMLNRLHDEMKPDENLLVCCKSFKKECAGRFANITIKKIPQMVLGRCEFGKDDYSLNIINLPHDEEPGNAEAAVNETPEKENPKPRKRKQSNETQPKLF